MTALGMPGSVNLDHDIERQYMERFGDRYLDYIWTEGKVSQRHTTTQPLDIKELQDMSNMDPQAGEEAKIEVLKVMQSRLKSLQGKEREKFIEQMDNIVGSSPGYYSDTASGILEYLNSNPEEMLGILNKKLRESRMFAREWGASIEDLPGFEIINWPATALSKIQYENVGHLVKVSGWVGYVENPVHIKFLHKLFKCPACGNFTESETCPNVCPECGYNKKLEFSPEHSIGISEQEIYVIENYDDATGSPSLISVQVTHSINQYVVGEKIEVTGILNFKKAKTGMFYFLDEHTSRKTTSEDLNPTAAEKKEINEIAAAPFKYIHKEFARSIIGDEYNIIKDSIALAIVGGSNSAKRNNIHILLVGDPGVGKSELLKAAAIDCPKGIMVSDASGPGLTAAISDMAGNRVMVPGILPLANHGLACIDELDKMHREDSQALHAAMEQGEFTKSKAGITMKFQTHTTIIAAANPVGSRFDQSKTILEQIDITESLLQRFDLIWTLRGTTAPDSSAILENTELKDNSILKKYFYACMKMEPSMPSNIAKEISVFFDDMRGRSGDFSISVRVLLALKRISEASAKMHLRTVVNFEDVAIAKNLITKYLKPFNFSIQNISTDLSLKEKMYQLLDLRKKKSMWKISEVRDILGLSEEDLDRVVNALKHDGKVYTPDDLKVGFI